MSVFVAILVDLDGCGIRLPGSLPNTEPTPKPHHITLAYLDGSNDLERIGEIAKVTTAVISAKRKLFPLSITLDRWGTFGLYHEILALHSEQRDTPLHQLVKEIRLRLLLAEASLSQRFPFHPHVSIAKLFGAYKPPTNGLQLQPPITLQPQRICLMQSVEGERYAILHEFETTTAGP